MLVHASAVRMSYAYTCSIKSLLETEYESFQQKTPKLSSNVHIEPTEVC